MEHHITAAEIEEMKQYLKDHPIDPAWDWECSKIHNEHAPWEQRKARNCKFILQELGEMEKDPPGKIIHPPAEEVERWKQYIREHPIHPEWDEAMETNNYFIVPYEELLARSFRNRLQHFGEWEE